jgi:hypothetical protein
MRRQTLLFYNYRMNFTLVKNVEAEKYGRESTYDVRESLWSGTGIVIVPFDNFFCITI